MSYLLVLVVVLLVGGALALLVLPRGRHRTDEDVTDRGPRPPAHPDRPVPGSAPQRESHGQP